jgi:thiamine-monophosphate kinase
MNEDSLVKRIGQGFRRRAGKPLALGIGDDAALFISGADCEIVLTCDWFLEGTHFLRGKHPADSVGWKCLARAVSDIAAMGGEPHCFLLSLALPSSLTGRWLDEFMRGLRRASRALRCRLAGGDTTQLDKVLINVSVIGEVHRGRAILRSGARPGDALFVSGTLGEAEYGLRQLLKQRGPISPSNRALRKHLYTEPRLALGQWLASNRMATAMMDLSDGLSTDLLRLCAASHVGARIEVDSLPAISLAKATEARDLALHGGDDYELLFAVKPGDSPRVPRRYRGLVLTRIGLITRELKLVLAENGKVRPFQARGWDPFRY